MGGSSPVDTDRSCTLPMYWGLCHSEATAVRSLSGGNSDQPSVLSPGHLQQESEVLQGDSFVSLEKMDSFIIK